MVNVAVRSLLLLIILMISSKAMMLSTDVYFLSDNIDYQYLKTSLSLDSIPVGSGFVLMRAGHIRQKHASSLFGIAAFQKDYASFSAAYSRRIGNGALSVHAGIPNLLRDPLFASNNIVVATMVSTVCTLGSSGWRFLPQLGVECGPADDNPTSYAIGITKISAQLDAGFGYKHWEWHLTYAQHWYEAVEKEAYESYLDTPEFFQAIRQWAFHQHPAKTIPANSIIQAGFFAFGPPIKSLPWLYTGLSVMYANSAHDLYFPTRTETSQGRVPMVYSDQTEYAHFPYATPQKELNTHFILAGSFAAHTKRMLVSEGSVKLSVPLFSHSTQFVYYQDNYGSLTSFKKASYIANGLGPMTIEVSIKKHIGDAHTAVVRSLYFAKPYAAYTYWGKNCYRYGDVSLSLSRHF